MKLLLLAFCLVVLSGCASSHYTYGTQGMDEHDGNSRVVHEQIIIGEPNKFLDASDWIWPGSLLGKLALWNHKVDSHEVSEETLEAMRLYLEHNELEDVQVLVNTYKPGTQWVRTFKNGEVGAPWRFTLGILSAVGYTILPGRFFGGDHYNPYSNTISIYSDIPAVALHEGAHAKDFNSREHKGLYAFLYAIPGVPLYHEAVASNDAVSYLHDQCDLDEEKKSYRTLHPAYGTYVGGTLGLFYPLESAVYTLAGTIPGHISGAISSHRAKRKATCDDLPNEPAEE